MEKRGILVTFMLAFILFFTVFLFECRRSDASEVKIVRLYILTNDGSKEVYIEPDTLWITEGTIVVWVNQGPAEEVKVVFEDGTNCQKLTDAGTAYSLKDGCYVTTWIPLGGTTSLRFNESGDLIYTVESTSGIKGKAKIIVHTPGVFKK